MASSFAATFRSPFENTIIDPAVMLSVMLELHESYCIYTDLDVYTNLDVYIRILLYISES